MVHVYYAQIGPLFQEAVFAEKLKLVSGQRRDKILRCKNNADKCRLLASGLLFRYGCIREGWDWKEVTIGEYGKPLMKTENCYFNLSHAGDYAAAVFSVQPVGIDVESCRRLEVSSRNSGEAEEENSAVVQKNRSDLLEAEDQKVWRLAKKVLSEREQESFYLFPREKRLKELIRIWTRKEAYAKAAGRGLSMDFSKIETGQEECYHTMELGRNYWMSICLPEAKSRNVGDISIEEIDLNKIGGMLL